MWDTTEIASLNANLDELVDGVRTVGDEPTNVSWNVLTTTVAVSCTLAYSVVRPEEKEDMGRGVHGMFYFSTS
jgi:hypothetical protein